MAGYRYYNDATIAIQETHGQYWSSSPYDIGAYYTLLFSTNIYTNLNNAYTRANALSVRCFKN
jgi:hypothetical protein